MRKNRQILADLFQKYLALTPDSSAMAQDNWHSKKFGKYLLDSEKKVIGR